MRPVTIYCDFCKLDHETKSLHIFRIDNDLLEACYCPCCDFMLTIGYAQSSEEEDFKFKLDKEKKEFEHFINTGKIKENI